MRCRDYNWIAGSNVISWCRFIKSSNLEMQIRPDMPVKQRGGEQATGLTPRFCIHVPARLKLNTKTLYTIFFDKQTARGRWKEVN